MDSESKASWLIAGLTGLIIIAGTLGCSFLIYKNITARNSTKSLDESKLFIGVPYQSGGKYVDLILSADTASGNVSKTYSSKDLAILEGQDETLRFFDYAKEPLFDLGGKSAGAWLADAANKLSAQTTALGLLTSNSVAINTSGIWLVDVPLTDGANPGVSHAYVYTTEGQ